MPTSPLERSLQRTLDVARTRKMVAVESLGEWWWLFNKMNEDGRRRNMEVGMIMNESYILPVVPHKAVAEVSRIGNV